MTTVDTTTYYQSLASSSATTGSTTNSSYSDLTEDFDSFLSLLTTQLQNQNPLDPMDTTEFTNQLVQFSALEQQMETNDSLSSILSSIDTLGISSALSYVGSEVTVDGDTAPLAEDAEGIDWYYELGEDAEAVTLTITDEDGNEVWTGSGETSEGTHSFTWDGTDSDGEAVAAGNYTLTIEAVDADGNSIEVGQAYTATVTGVDTSDGDVTLELGGLMRIDLDSVQRIAS